MHSQTATQLMTYLEESGSKWERKGLSYMPGRLKDWPICEHTIQKW